MVRSIAGTLVEVGLGKRSAGSLMGTLRARDRATAGQLAPPHGLCLWEVGYSDERRTPPAFTSALDGRPGRNGCGEIGHERGEGRLFAEGPGGPYPYPVAL